MTRLSVKLKNALGLSYYRYELTSSTYNATIDTQFTITCKCTDINGNLISGKDLTLYHDGTSVSTQTTNASGIATWNITPTSWGIHDFNVGNIHTQVNVTGFKTINTYGTTFYVFSVDGSTRTAKIELSTNNHNIKSGDAYERTDLVSNTYKPSHTVRALASADGKLVLYIDGSGTVAIRNTTSSAINGVTTSAILYWTY